MSHVTQEQLKKPSGVNLQDLLTLDLSFSPFHQWFYLLIFSEALAPNHQKGYRESENNRKIHISRFIQVPIQNSMSINKNMVITK